MAAACVQKKGKALAAGLRVKLSRGAGVGVVMALGCSGLDDAGDTCLLNQTCDTIVEPPEPTPEEEAWGCLGMPGPPIEPQSPTPAVYALPVVEWAVREPLTGNGLTATLCAIAPATCATPLQAAYEARPGMVGDMPVGIPMPLAPIPVYQGFDGFIKFQVQDNAGPSAAFLPVAYYLGGPVVEQSTITDLAVLMIRKNLLDDVIRESFARSDMGDASVVDAVGRGLVVLRAIDCQGELATDVRFTIDKDDVIPFLLPNSRLPVSGRLPYTDPIYTDELGTAGFVNVPPGTVQVAAYRRGDTTPFGIGQIGVVAGQISITVLRPAKFNTARLELMEGEATAP